MSEFKPEGYLGTNPLKELSDTKPLEDADVALIARVFQDPRRIPAVFWSYLQSWLEANPPLLPISQIVGFSQFTGSQSEVVTTETTTSQSPTNLATVGPQLTGLSDGIYNVWWGCQMYVVAGVGAWMGINVNGSDLGNDKAVVTTITTNVNSAARATEVTLSAGGNNTITAKYYVSNPGDTGLFQRRWMIALKHSAN